MKRFFLNCALSKILVLCFSFMSLNACQAFFYEEHIIGNYYLVAVDGDEDMCISYQVEDQKMYGEIIIPSTVFAVGYDEDFIIVKQHPMNFPDVDKSITNYFIIPVKNKIHKTLELNKIGPLSLEEFNKKRNELNIPQELAFTLVFDKLK